MVSFTNKIKCFYHYGQQTVVLHYDRILKQWMLDCPNYGSDSIKCRQCMEYYTPRIIEEHRNWFPADQRVPEAPLISPSEKPQP